MPSTTTHEPTGPALATFVIALHRDGSRIHLEAAGECPAPHELIDKAMQALREERESLGACPAHAGLVASRK